MELLFKELGHFLTPFKSRVCYPRPEVLNLFYFVYPEIKDPERIVPHPHEKNQFLLVIYSEAPKTGRPVCQTGQIYVRILNVRISNV